MTFPDTPVTAPNTNTPSEEAKTYGIIDNVLRNRGEHVEGSGQTGVMV